MNGSETKLLRVIAVDDERIALYDLCTKLSLVPGIQILHALASPKEALDKIIRFSPDVVFLDIQMPGCSGFEIASQIPATIPIIFVTASDAHAIRAFEVNALDYLVKPVALDRLKKSLERVRKRRDEVPSPLLLCRQDTALLTTDSGRLFIPMRQMLCIESQGNYSRIYLEDGRRFLVKRSLNQWEKQLDPVHYLRANRNWIASLDHILEVQSTKTGGALRLTGCDHPIPLSRRQAGVLKKRWNC